MNTLKVWIQLFEAKTRLKQLTKNNDFTSLKIVILQKTNI